MYLNNVLDSLQKRAKKRLEADHLYKLNEAIFNLPEDDVVDNKMSTKIFAAITSLKEAYDEGSPLKADPNFFYDYVALLATMQNQHFFNAKQHKTILQYLYQALGDEVNGTQQKTKSASAGQQAQVAKLEAENEQLRKELETLRALSDAVSTLKKFKPPAAPTSEAQPKAKAKSKSKKKGKKDDVDGEQENDGEDGKEETAEKKDDEEKDGKKGGKVEDNREEKKVEEGEKEG